MTEVRLLNISKRFGKTQVLKNLNLTVQEGELFTLVGPSGCGKSTLLHLIAGLESLTSGEIFFDGQAVTDIAPKDRDVAMVFQSYALYPHMSVYENIAFPLRMKKQTPSQVDEQVKKVVQLLGLDTVLSRKPKQLSGGQRQRVALGRAIVRKPRLFLLDEPLSNLDAQLRTEMRSELKKLHQTLLTTMIYVTHDQAEAMTLSDRMAILHEGTIQQCGTPQSVYQNPENLFVAGFIGSPPMNFLKGEWIPSLSDPIRLGENIHFSPSKNTLQRLKSLSHIPSELTIGMRPEHIQVSPKLTQASMMAHVSVLEPMGSENWVELIWGNHHLKARITTNLDIHRGDSVYFEFEEDKLLFFDQQTGHRLPL